MLEQKITISNKLGLHARAAAKFVAVASSFASEVDVEKDARRVNGKSIMGVMMLAAGKGAELTLFVEGADQAEAVAALQELVNNKFDEGE